MAYLDSVQSEPGDCPSDPSEDAWFRQIAGEGPSLRQKQPSGCRTPPPQDESVFDECRIFLSPRAKALLLENGAKRWSIELGGFLTNHLWHGILALAGLGASDELISNFAASYSKRLEPAREDRHDLPQDVPRAVTGRLLPLGSREGFMRHVRAFELEVDTGPFLATGTHPSAAHVQGTTLARLMDGLSGAAFHALIHLGTGLRLGIRPIIMEGLGYVAHSFLPVGGENEIFDSAAVGFGSDAQCIAGGLEVVAQIRADGELQRLLHSEWKSVQHLPTGFFQKCMHVFSARGGASPAAALRLLHYARQISLPYAEPGVAARALLFLGLQMFVCASSSSWDYFLLHGVTAAFSLLAVIPHLDAAGGRRACQRLLCGLLATFVAQGCPELQPLSSSPTLTHDGGDVKNEEGITDNYHRSKKRARAEDSTSEGSSATVRERSIMNGGRRAEEREWLVLRQLALGQRGHAPGQAAEQPLRNEHAYKLVWFCEEIDRDEDMVCSAAAGCGVGRGRVVPHSLLVAASTKVLTMPMSGRTGEAPLSPRKQRGIEIM